MSEHIRWTRNRREFVTDAFCGFGSLAVAQMAAATQAVAQVAAQMSAPREIMRGPDGRAIGMRISAQ